MAHELETILQKLILCRDLVSLKSTFALIPADAGKLSKYIRLYIRK